ncbi:MAG: CrcB family protein [Flavobacteriales bacterium]|nr:CrcB family protein [Flavobacteriales bacterium]
MQLYLAIFIGGGLGSLARFATGKAAVSLMPRAYFPVGTFAANMLSIVVFALVFNWLQRQQLTLSAETWRAALLVGFCGGFSTFSTFSFETFELFKMGHTGWAIANVVVSALVGVGVFALLLKANI